MAISLQKGQRISLEKSSGGALHYVSVLTGGRLRKKVCSAVEKWSQ
jgi:stress response protein SCP2